MSTRIIVTFFVIAFVAALVLLAANSISASTSSLLKSTLDVQEDVQTEPAKVKTEVGSSNIPTHVPTPFPETSFQTGPSLLQTRCTRCHQLQWLQQVNKTRMEWERTLSKMEKFNVKLRDSEKNDLLDYLANVDQP